MRVEVGVRGDAWMGFRWIVYIVSYHLTRLQYYIIIIIIILITQSVLIIII